MLKKVLIITYYWPPSGGAGVQRGLKFAKYLRDFGWEPIIYTVENGEYPVIDISLEKDIPKGITVIKRPILEPYTFYRLLIGEKKEKKMNPAFLSEKKKKTLAQKIAIWIRGNFFIPDARMFWINPSVNYLKKYLTENKVDAIMSTSPPHSVHLIAMKLHKELKLPWVADFRDPWTKIDFYPELKLTPWADKKHHQLEKEVLSTADAVISIGETIKNEFEEIVPRKYDVITNGYDEGDVQLTDKIERDKKFSIVHLGTLVETYKPLILWKALKELVSENKQFAKDLEIKLIGKADANVIKSIEENNLTKYLTLLDYIPHDQVTRMQKQSQVLLMKINETPSARGIITGKMFEYLASHRPILLIGPEDGDAAKIINEAGAGVVNNYTDVTALKSKILSFYNQYESGTLEVNPKGIDKYSRKNLTGKLVEVLDRISHA